VSTDAPIILKLDSSDADSTGELTFINNKITLSDSQATDGDLNEGSGGLAGLGLLITDAVGNQTLTVSEFRNNTLTIDNDTLDDHIIGVDVESLGNNAILFIKGIQRNVLTVQNNLTSQTSTNIAVGLLVSQVTLKAGFTSNEIDIGGYTGLGAGNDSFGKMSGLRIENDFDLSNGNFSHNTIYASNQESNTAAVMHIDGDITIDGNLAFNEFVSSNTAKAGQGWMDFGGTNTITGDVIGNRFEASTSGVTQNRAGVGWWIRNDVVATVSGNLNNNTFVASGNTTNGFGLWTSTNDSILIVSGNINSNQFFSINNGSGGRGMCFNAPSTISVVINGNIQSNQFTITNNEGSNKAIELNQLMTIGGTVSDNLINITDTFGVLNAGIAVTVGTNEGVIFNKVVQGNQINIITTSGNINDSFDIDLSATSGSDGIIFEKNSAAGSRSLTNLNNGASVDIDATNDNVIFNG
jgi:hypothetical protein